jgi:hypothetical protein
VSIDPQALPDLEVPASAALQLALLQGESALDGLDLVPETWDEHLLAMAVVHDLHLASIDELGGTERHQHHPTVVALKAHLEGGFLRRLCEWDEATEWGPDATGDDPVAALRAIAARTRLPGIYPWLAEHATHEQLVHFLALEGGPDGGFDDLVAACQVGISGEPKLEMAQNYWDEMGRGRGHDVHTELHHQMMRALGLETPPRHAQPTAVLERAALGGLLATNRWLQPQLVGALGLIELQAGPRCRTVAAGLRRVGAPQEALAFYDEHAEADPRHGKDWLEHVVRPLAEDPRWASTIVQGARWRSVLDTRFLDDTSRELRHHAQGTATDR